MFSFSTRGNVILFVLDGFQTDIFNEVVSEDVRHRETFAGFTYFRNASSGFNSTYPSIPLILTGQYYDNSKPFQDFLEQAFLSASSMPRVLKENGFRVDLFPWIPQAVHYDHRVFSNFTEIGDAVYDQEELHTLLGVSVFRYSPHFLKPFLVGGLHSAAAGPKKIRGAPVKIGRYRNVARRVPPMFPDRDRERLSDLRFVERMAALSAAVDSPPTFKYYHLLGLHPPIRMNERLEYEKLDSSRDNYKRYAHGVLSYTRMMLEVLRGVGVFNNSLILIVADHGLSMHLPDRYGRRQIAWGFWKGRALPLVLLKTPGSRGPMEASDAPVSLSDIPGTVLRVMQAPQAATAGPSMTEVREDDERDRLFYQYKAGNWTNEYLHKLVEYRVSGFSWLTDSWQPTGRVLEPTRSLEAFYKHLAKDPFLERPTLYTESRGVLPGFFYGISEWGSGKLPGLELSFPKADPERGDLVGLMIPIHALRPGQSYALHFEVLEQKAERLHDWLNARFELVVTLGDTVIAKADDSRVTGSGWRAVGHAFVAESSRTQLKMGLTATQAPERSQGRIAKMGIRNLAIEEVGGDRDD